MLKQEDLLEEVAAYLHTYLKAGTMKLDSFSKKIHHQIDDFEKLFIIRFLAKEETKAFVARLPILLRNFKTTTSVQKEVNIAEVRGAIDWEETIRLRSQQNYRDKLTFVTSENRRSYDTQENLVLKESLMVLYHYLFKEPYVARFFEQAYFKEWKELRKHLSDALRQNVYLKRVSQIDVSDRMIQNTRKHRNPLYRQAASLLARYRQFMRGHFDQAELEALLRETFIMPHEVEVLFELYWVIQVMKRHTETSTLHLIDGRGNLVASWEDHTYHFELYHDSDGPADLTWSVHTKELLENENTYTKKLYDIHQETKVLSRHLFNRGKSDLHWQGRPDILLVKRRKETDKIESLTIGEVKYSNNLATVSNGLHELVTYMHLLKDKGAYNEKIDVKGLLCIKDMDLAKDRLDKVEVLTPGKIKSWQNRVE